MSKPRTILAAVIVAVAAFVYVAHPPEGFTPSAMRSAALILFTVGFWAAGALPEHITGLLFLLLAMLFSIGSPEVVFSGFASATLWLVLGGLVMAEAVLRTGLAHHLAAIMFDRHASSYRRLVVAVVAASILLSFVMPATVGRVLLLLPIVIAAAQRAGFEHGSVGYDGLCLATVMATYQCGTAVLPANAPNLVLAGAAETLYNVPIHYADYLWMQFPVLGIVKGAVIVLLAWWLFPATARLATESRVLAPMTAEQRRMAIILAAALILWATDFLHGIKAGWIALAAGILCLLPRVGVMPLAAFNEVRMGPYFYVAAALGLGALTQHSGLSNALGSVLHRVLELTPGADFGNYTLLTAFSTFAGLFTTNTAQPAVLAPLAKGFAEATGWPLKTALMTLAVGFSTVMLPHQVPPIVVGMHTGRLRLAPMLKLSLPLAFVSIFGLVPLQYLWWRLIGAF
jgi:anion transporter